MNKKEGIRIDKLLVDRGYVKSRERAKDLIASGHVFTDNALVKKPSTKYDSQTRIKVTEKDIAWVSRAGLKLEKAIKEFDINIKDTTCLDIGASTGGFTQVLLHYGAKKVYALDVGHDQIAGEVKEDPRVVVMEKTNIRNVKEEMFPHSFDIVTVDVSFISLQHVIPKIKNLLKGEAVLLIKPQFEAGKSININNPALHEKIISKIKFNAKEEGLKTKAITDSPIKGGKGNKEFLLHLTKSSQ